LARDVDAYIASAPEAVQPMLRELRAAINEAAPEASERISYGMPDYEDHGPVANFAGYKNHVGLYGVIHEDREIVAEAKQYLENRSTLRFPVGRPLPVVLIKKVVAARVAANRAGERPVKKKR
jgi:uncharacterized protein YdhG (YjbR/CyaY superfamily)